jgi:hypothetical protein
MVLYMIGGIKTVVWLCSSESLFNKHWYSDKTQCRSTCILNLILRLIVSNTYTWLITDLWIFKVHVNIKVTVSLLLMLSIQTFDCVAHPTHAITVMCDTLTPPNVDLIVKSTWNKKYQTLTWADNWHVICKLWQQISMVSSIQLLHDVIVFVIIIHFRLLDFLKVSGFPA